MTGWMKNQIANLYNFVSRFAAATREALAERLPGVRETASLLCNRMTDNIRYRGERLKDIVKKEAREEEEEITQ